MQPPPRQAPATDHRHGTLTVVALVVLAGATLAIGGCAASRVHASKALAAQAVAYQASPPQPAHRLLVVGDSTAVGTGATAPERSLPGLIGQAHPDWTIRNLARNGARFADVAAQLASADGSYDTVLVLAGGNDVIRLTSRAALRAQLAQVVALARQRGRQVVLMPCGNVGHAPFFAPPLSWWMGRRSETLHAEVAAAAQASGVRYVRLLLPKAQDPFVLQADLLNAADGLHPSDAGYAQWFRSLVDQGGLAAAAAQPGRMSYTPPRDLPAATARGKADAGLPAPTRGAAQEPS